MRSADGFHHTIGFDATTKRVRARGAWQTMEREHALKLVEQAVREDLTPEARLPPKEAVVIIREHQRLMEPKRDVKVGWITPKRHIVLSISEGDADVHLRFDMHGDPVDGRPRTPRAALPHYKARLAVLRRLIAEAPAGLRADA